jgi:hypothetical protein
MLNRWYLDGLGMGQNLYHLWAHGALDARCILADRRVPILLCERDCSIVQFQNLKVSRIRSGLGNLEFLHDMVLALGDMVFLRDSFVGWRSVSMAVG